MRGSVLLLDLSWWDRIQRLYIASDKDFSLPLSQRKITAEDMMEGVFFHGEYLGVLVDDTLVAVGGYRIFEGDKAELHGVLVQSDHRWMGLGKDLVIALIRRAEKRGAVDIETSTWEGSNSVEMILSCGFREVERFPDPGKRPAGVRSIRFHRHLNHEKMDASDPVAL